MSVRIRKFWQIISSKFFPDFLYFFYYVISNSYLGHKFDIFTVLDFVEWSVLILESPKLSGEPFIV
jgi:hypothetical protein